MKRTGSVGIGGLNRKDDAARDQEALKIARVKTSSGASQPWNGRTDGSHSRALEQAISGSQSSHQFKPSGAVNPTGSTIAKLAQKLPSRLRPKSDKGKQNGKTRFFNPTGQSLRGVDKWGSGAFGAARDGGRRRHSGTDFLATEGQQILAVATGYVTKLGYPYADNLAYRYVEITTTSNYAIRHFYVCPGMDISIGVWVAGGSVIGTYQSLATRYPSITEHVHIEIRKSGQLINPTALFP